ncbi:hypothetical protein GTO87_05940 [Ligilactobacillus saerimneri]|uniref:Uncharacterized protein n=1 Tax=Ligilactobacillus saerimneri TaxID=228229 RepID=A0A7H9EKU7_9LACO|nr:hypothetical protein [Ligilactobacillus saerimneri]QLL78181.1 hypothetical protein GTO87_05940 [Ligilactobacillus saerimneri]
MVSCNLVREGRTIASDVSFPQVPSKGDVIANADPKKEHYLVLRVEYVIGFENVNLHVKEFPNQLACVNNVDGFR